MSCSCGQSKLTVKNATTASVSHTILPGQSCIFCTEKHFGQAYVLLSRFGNRMGYRLAILGELDAARLHCQKEYRAIASRIAELEQLMVITTDCSIKLLNDIGDAIATELANHPEGQDTTDTAVTVKENAIMIGSANPLAGVIYFACAWRLALEVGYTGANRSQIIGNLALAQMHLMTCDAENMQAVRSLRHKIQSGENIIPDDWLTLAITLDFNMRVRWQQAIEKYGTDLSWLLNP